MSTAIRSKKDFYGLWDDEWPENGHMFPPDIEEEFQQNLTAFLDVSVKMGGCAGQCTIEYVIGDIGQRALYNILGCKAKSAIATTIALKVATSHQKKFWFKIAAEAKLKPEVYSSIQRIYILPPTKILGQKTFFRWLVAKGH